jgi:hypothetical protein
VRQAHQHTEGGWRTYREPGFGSERGSWADNSQLSIVFDLMSADMAKGLIRSDMVTPF